MNPVLPTSFRAVLMVALTTLAVLPLSFALAATAPLPASTDNPAPKASSLPDQTIQRIRTEDAGTRIDELRVGGETQNITVQPKTGGKVPYEVKPAESAKGNAPSSSSGDTNGSRVWNVLKF
jgi:starvation-inducible outer membrane lipoprotein